MPRREAEEDCALSAPLPPSLPVSDSPTDAEPKEWLALLALAGRSPGGTEPGARAASPDTLSSSIWQDLYGPLCSPLGQSRHVLGHLGQSMDGYIATASGDSAFVNDRENIRHLHRLRALHDAVIVGAGTVTADDPKLTTRLVPGPNPVRVVLDPQRRTPVSAKVFNDGEARTVLVVAETTGGDKRHGQAEVLFVPAHEGMLDLNRVVESLVALGLRRLFVEGGGTTVSRFLEAGLLDRLQIAIAPVLIGRGTPGLRLRPSETMDQCLRPSNRVFTMGQDVLFDCDLKGSARTS